MFSKLLAIMALQLSLLSGALNAAALGPIVSVQKLAPVVSVEDTLHSSKQKKGPKWLRSIAISASIVGLNFVNSYPALAGHVFFDSYKDEILSTFVMETKTHSGYSIVKSTSLRGFYNVDPYGSIKIKTGDYTDVWYGALIDGEKNLKISDNYRKSMKLSKDVCRANGDGKNGDGTYDIICDVNGTRLRCRACVV